MGKMMTLATVVALGCAGGSKEDESSAADPGVDSGEPGFDDSLPLANGTFLVGFSVGPVAGLVVPLQVEIATSMDDVGQRSLDSFILRATDGAESVSPDLTAIAEPVPVDDVGSFVAVMPPFILPPEYSPTGQEVEIDSVMSGTIVDEEFFCGEVSGTILSFDMDLANSTFGAAPWADRILGAPSGCEAESLEPVARIETCPELVEGRNTEFVSAQLERTFDLILPEDYDATATYPLAFALHGIGASIEKIIYDNGMADYTAANGYILVAPEAIERGGRRAWDPVSSADYNVDIVLFDDLLTCVTEQFSVDPNHVHLTGMSLGGLMTGTLISTRSEVIGSTAPLSGGFMTPPMDETLPLPTLVVWGGENDTSNGQDFHQLAEEMMDTLVERDHFVVGCNHGMDHVTDATFWPYVFQFFTDHPQGVTPEPYADGLPALFPAYCAIVDSVAGR